MKVLTVTRRLAAGAALAVKTDVAAECHSSGKQVPQAAMHHLH